jgi:hypothetical protein
VRLPPGALPDAAQRRLLEAALGEGEAAPAAHRAWRDLVDLDDVDGESYRLLPLLARNLRRQRVDDGGRLAGLYRRNFAANALALRAAAEAIAALEAEGIRTMVLKGAALALLHYRDRGARVMGDVDVLVEPPRASAAAEVLARLGYTPVRAADRFDAAHLARIHSCGLRDRRGRQLDLHWYASGEARRPGDDDRLWQAAVPLSLEGVATRAPCATDHLYLVCAHAFASGTSHLRWIADAAVLLRGGDIDAGRLVALARARRWVAPLAAALRWLRDFGLPVPPAALAALDSEPVRLLDRLELAGELAEDRFTPARVLLRLWCRHRRSSPATGLALAAGFPAFVARAYVDRRRAPPT